MLNIGGLSVTSTVLRNKQQSVQVSTVNPDVKEECLQNHSAPVHADAFGFHAQLCSRALGCRNQGRSMYAPGLYDRQTRLALVVGWQHTWEFDGTTRNAIYPPKPQRPNTRTRTRFLSKSVLPGN